MQLVKKKNLGHVFNLFNIKKITLPIDQYYGIILHLFRITVGLYCSSLKKGIETKVVVAKRKKLMKTVFSNIYKIRVLKKALRDF